MLKTSIVILFSCQLLFCNTEKLKPSSPVIKDVTRYSSTIAWQTSVPCKSAIIYYSEGEKEKKITYQNKVAEHRVKISGLLPGRVYHYRVQDQKKTFSFRTAPSSVSSFRFVFIPEGSNAGLEKIKENYPDIIILFSDNSRWIELQKKDLGNLRTRIPIYSLPIQFVWGNSFFSASADPLPDSQLENLFLISFKESGIPPESLVAKNIVRFHPGGDSLSYNEKNGIKYLQPGKQAVLVEVQGPGITVRRVSDNKTLVISETPPSYKKTCVYCRRLLEDKRYKESIAWYRRFMRECGVPAQADDAQYQIAFIYDRYLFDYAKAVREYQAYLEQYPESKRARQAKHRLAYIQKHTGNDFKPLAVFEKARLTALREEGDTVVGKIESLLDQYPQTSLRKEILLWLGSICSEGHPQKAVGFYRELVKHHESSTQWKAMLSIGDIYYRTGQYASAEEMYQKMENTFPERKSDLKVKIFRSRRNQRRAQYLYVCIALLCAGSLLVLLLPPAGFSANGISAAGTACLFAAVSIAGPVAIWYDVLKPVIPFSLVFVPSFSFVIFLTAQFIHKSRFSTRLVNTATGVVFNWVMTVSLLYVLLFSFHYLFIIERLLLQ